MFKEFNYYEKAEIRDYIRDKYSAKVLELLDKYAQQIDLHLIIDKENEQRWNEILDSVVQMDENKMKQFLEKDNNSSFPYNKYYLLRYMHWVLLNTVVENDNSNYTYPPEMLRNNDIWDEQRFRFILDMCEKYVWRLGDFPQKAIKSISMELAKEVKKLINGYEIYLMCIEENTKSKRIICKEIEGQIGVANVRQEFHRYDTFFNHLENFIRSKIPNFRLDIESKIKISDFCVDRAVNPTPF